jgi:hypothetical protein
MEETKPGSRRDQEKRFALELQKLLHETLSNAYAIRIGKSLLYKLEVDVDGELRPKAASSAATGAGWASQSASRVRRQPSESSVKTFSGQREAQS